MRRDEDPWKIISQSMASLYTAGKALNWQAFHKENKQLRVVFDLPSYGFDEKNYWLQYTGDWLIYKGDYPKSAPVQAVPKAIEAAPVKPRKRLSTAVQGIVSEEVKDNIATVVAESDFADPKLFPVIAGHLVNGNGLCPSTLYADMIYTLADYTYKLLRPGEECHFNIGTMDNPAPLLLKNINEPESQTFKATCSVNLNEMKADFLITSFNGKKDVVHAKCVLEFENPAAWKAEWSKQAYLIQSRIDLLKHKVENGEADKVSRAMAYKLFGALVDYSDKFQGMQSVLLDGAEFEAASTVKFRAGPDDGDFYMNPYFIDSLCHITGFTVNATVNPQDECYISHGWSSFRMAERTQYDKTYYAYVKMQPIEGSKMRAGDVWIFNDKREVVGVAGAVRFQCVPRKLMNVMMPKPGQKAVTSAAKATPATTTTAAPVSAPKAFAKAAPVAAAPAPKIKTPKKEKAPKVKKVSASKPAAAGNLSVKAFDIIAQEIEVDHSELVDNVQWTDLGVDSLMSLTISGKFREDMDLEVESSLFTDYVSVGALRKYFAGLSGPSDAPAPVDDASSVESSDEDDSDSDDGTVESGITTPETVDVKQHEHGRSAAVEAVATAPSAGGSDMIETIRKVICQEMEMELEEIVESTDLSNLGMDSLMALTVLGKLREDHDLDLDPTILADNPTLGHLRQALGLDKPAVAPKAVPAPTESAEPAKAAPVVAAPPIPVVINMPPATSVLLQGNPKTATKNFFLFPDGSGSATSYVSIPAIDSKNLAVYGLNCPFMKDPTSYTCGIEGVSKLYMEEVMRRQPIGPYILGGWSAGGVIAYEVCKQLSYMAKTNPEKNWYVEKLVLIDSPCPVKLEPLPARLHHFFDEIGLLGTGTASKPSRHTVQSSPRKLDSSHRPPS
ncbi:polyketide synthase [Elasticomyces elasticus]|nr:polyketide synthase [Elasticomyces elasticus]